MTDHGSRIDIAGTRVRVGLFGVGLETYWPQFDGLRETIGRLSTARLPRRLREFGADLIDAGLIDNPVKAREAASLFRREEVDLIFLYISTYALSSTVLPVAQGARVPLVLLNLQPVAQLDYEAFNRLGDRGRMTGLWLEHCQSCSLPEIVCVLNRAEIPSHLVTGYLQDEEAWNEIRQWVNAARVAAGMRANRVGVLGHYYAGMLDVYSDLTQQSAVFGNHFELLEMCELHSLRGTGQPRAGVGKAGPVPAGSSNVSPDVRRGPTGAGGKDLLRAGRAGRAARLGLPGLLLRGRGGRSLPRHCHLGHRRQHALTGHHVPVAGECEIKNVQAMKIMDLFGAGGSFSEFYLADFNDNVVFLGHDGPAHFAIAEGRVSLVPLPVYHGKPGQGLSIQMTVRYGPVTLLAVVQGAGGKVSLLAAEGESVPGTVLQIGNTNTRYRFSIGAKAFINQWSREGPAHHCAIGVGHLADKLAKLGAIQGLAVKQIC